MPKIMANRKPFDLRKTLVYYNLFQTIFSAWIFYEVSNNLPVFSLSHYQSLYQIIIKSSELNHVFVINFDEIVLFIPLNVQ